LFLKRLFLISSCMVTLLFADGFNGLTVSKVIVNGNRVTERDVIVREMLLEEGGVYSDSLRIVSERRIHSLFLFNNVEIIPVPDNQQVALLVNVTERLFLYPFPVLNVEDRDWEKLTYGGGFAHVNFRGRAEKLFGSLFFGYKPGFEFGYDNPWIGGPENRYTLSVLVSRFSWQHKTEEFDERHFTSAISVGKYWNRYLATFVKMDYDRIVLPDSLSNRLATGNNREELFGFAVVNSFDNRDFTAYPSSGWLLQNSILFESILRPENRYIQVTTDARRYLQWNDIILAGRLLHIGTFGNLPLYRTVYFGFSERVRGHFSEVYEGKHSILGSAEFRFPLLQDRLISLPSFFLPPSSTQNLKFGLNGAIFIDSGIIWSQPAQLATDNIVTGFGVGLHFRLPYIEIARLEAGFDLDFNSEIIFEVGAAL